MLLVILDGCGDTEPAYPADILTPGIGTLCWPGTRHQINQEILFHQ
jgi:hypothetical protein